MTLLDDAPNLAHLFAHARLGSDLTPEQHEAWNHALDALRAHALSEPAETATNTEPEPEDPQPTTDPDPVSEGSAPPTGAPEDAAPEPEAPEEAPGEDREPNGEPEDAEDEPEPDSTATPVIPGSSGSLAGLGPARPGELQDKVAVFLADHVGTEYTVTEVAKELGHSGGAVGNAMKTLASDGRIIETSASPRKYTARTPDPYRP
ncbi:hypothetical protein KDK95_34910, partial [Actinospica sp. MGRD01-02]|nr:hypothetical protein [Actinospica acidithermotolerans]